MCTILSTARLTGKKSLTFKNKIIPIKLYKELAALKALFLR